MKVACRIGDYKLFLYLSPWLTFCSMLDQVREQW